jgi:Predicted Zn peptidase
MINKQLPKNPRLEYIAATSVDFFSKYNISKLPIQPLLIENPSWRIRSYGVHAQKNGVTIQDICEQFSDEAFCVRRNGKFFILYNETVWSGGRILFSILHEIGHIMLGHYDDFSEIAHIKNADVIPDVLEREADLFAVFTAAPPIVLEKLGIEQSVPDIQNLCNVSEEFAQILLSTNNFYKKVFDSTQKKNILKSFHSFLFSYRCQNCLGDFIIDQQPMLYCPYCSHTSITRTTDKGLSYDEISTFPKSGKNFCTLCNINLLPNFRYCTKCGSQSTYFQNGNLSSWHSHPNAQTTLPKEFSALNIDLAYQHRSTRATKALIFKYVLDFLSLLNHHPIDPIHLSSIISQLLFKNYRLFSNIFSREITEITASKRSHIYSFAHHILTNQDLIVITAVAGVGKIAQQSDMRKEAWNLFNQLCDYYHLDSFDEDKVSNIYKNPNLKIFLKSGIFQLSGFDSRLHRHLAKF